MNEKKICVIAGGARGKGSLLAEEYAQKGCILAVMDIDKKSGIRLKNEMKDKYGTPMFFFHGDLASEEDVELFAGAVIGQYETADYLFYRPDLGESSNCLPKYLQGHLDREGLVIAI